MSKNNLVLIVILLSCNNDNNVIREPVLTSYTLNICNVTWPNIPCFEPYLNITITFPYKYFSDDNEFIAIDNSKFYFIDTMGIKSIPFSIEDEKAKNVSRAENKYIIEVNLSGCNLEEIT